MSRSAFAARFQELFGQTPLDYLTEWRMQKTVQLLPQRDKKLVDIAQSVGYESDAAFSKAQSNCVIRSPGIASELLANNSGIVPDLLTGLRQTRTDQSHLIHDFRNLVHITPSGYKPHSPQRSNHVPIVTA
jgi:AraC-like DNA-binding protein